MASGRRSNGRTSAAPEAFPFRRRLPDRLPVARVTVDGERLPTIDAWLVVTDDPPDFELCITTQARPLGTVVRLEVVLADGRVMCAQGVDADPSPWTHRYVNGVGDPIWTKAR
jgi:hypothetical protein